MVFYRKLQEEFFLVRTGYIFDNRFRYHTYSFSVKSQCPRWVHDEGIKKEKRSFIGAPPLMPIVYKTLNGAHSYAMQRNYAHIHPWLSVCKESWPPKEIINGIKRTTLPVMLKHIKLESFHKLSPSSFVGINHYRGEKPTLIKRKNGIERSSFASFKKGSF